MVLEIIEALPPNWDVLSKKFVVDSAKIVVCWGDRLFNPGGGRVGPDLLVHEGVHRRQQVVAGGPEKWWDRYLEEDRFRFGQEAEAYRAQWRWVEKNIGRRELRVPFLMRIAKDLAGPVYGNLCGVNEAVLVIRGGGLVRDGKTVLSPG